jgi:hypothetical protein
VEHHTVANAGPGARLRAHLPRYSAHRGSIPLVLTLSLVAFVCVRLAVRRTGGYNTEGAARSFWLILRI